MAQKSHDDVLQKQAEKLELSQKENSEMKIEIDNLRLQVAQEWFLLRLTKLVKQNTSHQMYGPAHFNFLTNSVIDFSQ